MMQISILNELKLYNWLSLQRLSQFIAGIRIIFLNKKQTHLQHSFFSGQAQYNYPQHNQLAIQGMAFHFPGD